MKKESNSGCRNSGRQEAGGRRQEVRRQGAVKTR